MHGIIAVLEDEHLQLVTHLWRELERRFHLKQPEHAVAPHLSFHVAAAYEGNLVEQIVQRFVAETAVFSVKATGIGIFNGEEPVLYVPVARSRPLALLHRALWPALNDASRDSVAYYQPQNWFPHITLAKAGLTPTNIGPVVQWLNQESLTWNVPITNLALTHDTGAGHALKFQYFLQEP